jgi:hypothetical protein
VSFLKRWVDERFLTHRQRSTSIAGITAAVLALLLFQYRFYTTGVWNVDLLGIGLTFVVVKIALMIWYRFRD